MGPEPNFLQHLTVDGIQPYRTLQEKVKIPGAITDDSVYTISEPAGGAPDDEIEKRKLASVAGNAFSMETVTPDLASNITGAQVQNVK